MQNFAFNLLQQMKQKFQMLCDQIVFSEENTEHFRICIFHFIVRLFMIKKRKK